MSSKNKATAKKNNLEAMAKEVHVLRTNLPKINDFRSFRNTKEKIEKLHGKIAKGVQAARSVR